jgi:hypothetical protein
MWTVEKDFQVKLGGNIFINVPRLIVNKGQTLFTLKRSDGDGQLGIYFELFDATGRHVASVKRNRIYPATAGRLYELKDQAADVCLLRDVRNGEDVCTIRRTSDTPTELEVSVRLYTPDGFLIKATPTEIEIPETRSILGGNTLRGAGIEIG